MGIISDVKIYESVNVESVKQHIINRTISINTYNYIADKPSENIYILSPKSNNFLFHNSFLPRITISLCEDKVVMKFSLTRGVKILFLIISVLMLLFEMGLLIQTSGYYTENIFSLLLFPCMYLFQLLFISVGFKISYRVVEKKILRMLEIK